MVTGNFKDEKTFLKEMVLGKYNKQYRKAIKAEECVVYSITPAYGMKYGYEVVTIVENDYLRLRFYFNLGALDYVEPYRLEVDRSQVTGALGDEVYVALGSVQTYYVDDAIYSFRWIESTLSAETTAFLLANGEVFEFMNGDQFSLVS